MPPTSPRSSPTNPRSSMPTTYLPSCSPSGPRATSTWCALSRSAQQRLAHASLPPCLSSYFFASRSLLRSSKKMHVSSEVKRRGAQRAVSMQTRDLSSAALRSMVWLLAEGPLMRRTWRMSSAGARVFSTRGRSCGPLRPHRPLPRPPASQSKKSKRWGMSEQVAKAAKWLLCQGASVAAHEYGCATRRWKRARFCAQHGAP